MGAESSFLCSFDLCLWEVYQVSQAFDLMWWVVFLYGLRNTLVQAQVSICCALCYSNTSICSVAANFTSTFILGSSLSTFVMQPAWPSGQVAVWSPLLLKSAPLGQSFFVWMLTQCSSCRFAFPWLMLLTVLQLAVQFFWSSLFQRCYNGCPEKCECFSAVHLNAAVFDSCRQSAAGQSCHHNDNDNSLLIFVVTDVIQIWHVTGKTGSTGG